MLTVEGYADGPITRLLFGARPSVLKDRRGEDAETAAFGSKAASAHSARGRPGTRRVHGGGRLGQHSLWINPRDWMILEGRVVRSCRLHLHTPILTLCNRTCLYVFDARAEAMAANTIKAA